LVEGRNVVLEWRNTAGSLDRAGEAAGEFARMKVDVILVAGDSEALAAKRATATIPIVAIGVGDPVGNGLVESLARLGGNVTGTSLALSETAGKRLELLREVVPSLKRVAIFGNSGNPMVASERNAAIAAAHAVGFDTIISGVQTAEDIAPTIEALKGSVDALYVCEDPFTVAHRAKINAAALAARLPTMRLFGFITEEGGLLSYGPNIFDLWRRAIELTDKILRGTKPADIPVEQPTKFELVVNLKTAKALGLTVPETFLTRADKVIEGAILALGSGEVFSGFRVGGILVVASGGRDKSFRISEGYGQSRARGDQLSFLTQSLRNSATNWMLKSFPLLACRVILCRATIRSISDRSGHWASP
jgi:putative tryptophan/tyrosine transport system substrate-binding protein